MFSERPANRRLCLYIPNKDRNGNPVYRLDEWINEACLVLVAMCGGASRPLPLSGFWQTSAGKLIEETTHTVFSFIDPHALKSNWSLLSDFIERFLTETNQESVAIEYDGAMHFVSSIALVTA